ncbi:hypothetical protein [Thermomonospora catenispora]|uniref:hypothetical protein n=1 Tax=Thermomonospora catenispora TaxID=2493090 RepID=UPI001F4FC667|nr:hypothetical protein [Thermomonospora catenispora]
MDDQKFHHLMEVPPGGGVRYPELRFHLCVRLASAQVNQNQQIFGDQRSVPAGRRRWRTGDETASWLGGSVFDVTMAGRRDKKNTRSLDGWVVGGKHPIYQGSCHVQVRLLNL